MVLRHIRPPVPSSAILSIRESDDGDDESCPIDLSNKHASSPSEVPRNLSSPNHSVQNPSRTALGTYRTHGSHSSVRWRPSGHVMLLRNDENSIVDDTDVHSGEHHSQNFIPLSRIQARYQQRHGQHSQNSDSSPEQRAHVSPSPEPRAPDKVLTKRARLDCLISHIKQSKPPCGSRSDATTPPELGSSFSDDQGSLRTSPTEPPQQFNGLGIPRYHPTSEDDEPCNLACAKQRPNDTPEPIKFDTWKTKGPMEDLAPLSPDPEAFQQQMTQLQLTASAAMMGDGGGGLIKGMQGYPPWFILNYYSQLFHNFQAQQILHQYALQSNNSTSTVTPDEKSPSTPRSSLGMAGYNCQSPLSPASLSEGQLGAESDDGSVGQITSVCVNGKRAPRAMTGRHVRTGTGASPATLQTLRLKIEERQRLKAQQLRSDGDQRQLPKNRNGTAAQNLFKLHKKTKK